MDAAHGRPRRSQRAAEVAPVAQAPEQPVYRYGAAGRLGALPAVHSGPLDDEQGSLRGSRRQTHITSEEPWIDRLGISADNGLVDGRHNRIERTPRSVTPHSYLVTVASASACTCSCTATFPVVSKSSTRHRTHDLSNASGNAQRLRECHGRKSNDCRPFDRRFQQPVDFG
jgi:hypothetical protein